MLAGRKLLLADDSITIQKIVALTFAEEGLEVIAVSDGAEAIKKLEETTPDVVLADVFMPRLNGYQVCEHIKQTERLKHIPVMLMVGSFEPFDEVEARRVGADDILSKPFQSIRTLMDKVGALLGREPAVDHAEETGARTATVAAAEEAPVPAPQSEALSDAATCETTPSAVREATTQELPPPEIVPPPEEPMTTEELEITTADTQPLSPELRDRMEHLESEEVPVVETVLEAETMTANLNTDANPGIDIRPESFDSFDDALLDLEQFESGFDESDDVILDVDFDAPPADMPNMAPNMGSHGQSVVAVSSRFEAPAFSPAFAATDTVAVESVSEQIADSSEMRAPEFVEAAPLAETISAEPEAQESVQIPEAEVVSAGSSTAGASGPTGLITLDQLAPEVIDAIARRAVEQLSEKAIHEIAWEVVPQLSELLIKRRLEEQESQNK
ncbi:MAG: response regulator receiver domain protein (CheY-like) [Acidobacteria bacterium]|nr:response regulator receiver domain protein (CheY-like) [Acidobacteriota bacterium]